MAGRDKEEGLLVVGGSAKEDYGVTFTNCTNGLRNVPQRQEKACQERWKEEGEEVIILQSMGF